MLPDWTWEALEKEAEGLYYGRVKSPLTYDTWEYGSFTREQLEEAGAYRVDLHDDEDVYPDGGWEELVNVYETEFNALYDASSYDERDTDE